MKINVKCSGEYRFQIFGEGMKLKTDTGWFFNLLTDSFFNAWIGGSSQENRLNLQYCGVGSGTSAPTNSDTTITQIGSRATIFASPTTVSGMVTTQELQFRFALNAIIGTIGEVGLFSASTGGSVSSRTLIKDTGGVPTTITLVTGDTLYVTWRGKMTLPSADITGTKTIGGIAYNYVMRPANYNQGIPGDGTFGAFLLGGRNNGAGAIYCFGFQAMFAYATQTLGSVSSSPSGSAATQSSAPIIGAYTTGIFSRTLTYTFLPAQGNPAGGIGSLLFSSSVVNAGWQISFAAVSGGARIPKDGTMTFTFELILTYSR